MYGQQYGFFEDEKTTKGLYDRRFDSLFGLSHLGRFIPFWIPVIAIFLRSKLRAMLGGHESTGSFIAFMQVSKVPDCLRSLTDTSTVCREDA